MSDNHAFAPEWVSEDIGIDISDFDDELKNLNLDFKIDVEGPLFDKCRSNFSIIDLILEEPPAVSYWDIFSGEEFSGDYTDKLVPEVKEVDEFIENVGDGMMGGLSLM